MPTVRSFQESFTPRRPETLNPLELLRQALQADPYGASGAVGGVFQNPLFSRGFATLAKEMQLGGTSGLPMRAEEMLHWHEFLAKLFNKAGLQAGPGSTFGSNFMNSLMGQTFGKNITPWSGAAHQVPRQAMSEEALLAALLSGMIP